MTTSNDTGFTGSIPEIYERYLVPMLFEPYARDLGSRLGSIEASRVLEIAAGTGVVTRAMADVLPPHVEIVATDLNQAMLDRAAQSGAGRPVTWQQADAMQLPFDDGSFDLVVTDIDMPRMDGIELVTLIKRDPVFKPVPVMIVSYKDRDEDRRRGLEAGADYYLAKGSFHDEALLDAVRDLIGESTE